MLPLLPPNVAQIVHSYLLGKAPSPDLKEMIRDGDIWTLHKALFDADGAKKSGATKAVSYFGDFIQRQCTATQEAFEYLLCVLEVFSVDTDPWYIVSGALARRDEQGCIRALERFGSTVIDLEAVVVEAANLGLWAILRHCVEKLGVDIRVQCDLIVRAAGQKGSLEMLKFAHERGAPLNVHRHFALTWALHNGFKDAAQFIRSVTHVHHSFPVLNQSTRYNCWDGFRQSRCGCFRGFFLPSEIPRAFVYCDLVWRECGAYFPKQS